MPYIIDNVADLLLLWAENPFMEQTSTEVHTSCPFCDPTSSGEIVVHNGITFVGKNRFIITKTGAFCRTCQRNGTSPRHISFQLLAEKLRGSLSPEFAVETTMTTPRYEHPETFTDTTVAEAHSAVFRRFWHRFNWTDETINKFKLGLYELYRGEAAHVVPYKAISTVTDQVTGWVMEGRTPNDDGGTDTRRSRGLTQDYVFFVKEGDDTTVVITEGLKDGISAYQLGFRNILSISGSTIWAKEKSEFLSRQGFTNAIVFGDNDEAGKAFNQDVVDRDARVRIPTSVLVWPDDVRLKYDVTNILQDHGIEGGMTFISTNLEIASPLRPMPISLEPREVINNEIQDYIEIEEIRGDGERSISYNLSSFVGDYGTKTKRGYGSLLLLNASPGTGKTHTLVRTVEPIARKRRDEVVVHKDNLLLEIASIQQEIAEEANPDNINVLSDMLNSLQNKVRDVSHSSVLWFSKFKKSTADLMELAQDPELWFDYEGRSPDNCQNFGITQELGQKNHDIRGFCETACPFRDACRIHGYLSQDERMKEKSITIVRHQNLINEALIKKHRDLVVVDESPLDVIEAPMEIERRTLAPVTPTWYMQLNADPDFPPVKSATLFIDAIKNVMDTVGDQEEVSGTELFRRMERFIESVSSYTLKMVMENIDQSVFEDYYQPTYLVSGVSDIYYRTVPFLYRAVAKEYLWYAKQVERNIQTDVSQITISRTRFGQIPILTLFRMQTPKISSSTPVVVADATTREPELYQIGFDRRVDVYAPESRNENLQEHVFWGKDFTTAFRKKKFGAVIRDKKNLKATQAESIFGEKFDLDEIKMTGDVYDDNQAVLDYFDMITYVATKNESCLVVTHKDVQDLLEAPFRAKFPVLQERIKWGHFGALRGDNQYKDLKSAVIFGVPRIPYDVIAKRARAWSAVSGNMEKMGSEMIYKLSQYGNSNMANEHLTYKHTFAQRLVDIQEKGEIQQATERIRPHVTKEAKQIYYCMTRPMDAKNVVDVRPFEEVMKEWRDERKIEDGADYILSAILTTGKCPTVNEVRRACHLQYDMAKGARDLVRERNPEVFSGAKQ